MSGSQNMTKSVLNSSTETAVIIRMITEKNIHITPIARRSLYIHTYTYGSRDSHMTPKFSYVHYCCDEPLAGASMFSLRVFYEYLHTK